MSIDFSGAKVAERQNFLDYVYGGCEINLSVAIDFSINNKVATNPCSLHFSIDGKESNANQYLLAIKSAVTVMQYYNSTKRISAYGFGAKVVSAHNTSNCFALTGDIFNPEVDGISGLIDAYQKTLAQVQLSSPANLSGMIDSAMKIAEGSQVNETNQKYHVLVVLTNGEIEDIKETINSTVRSSLQPMSIIIVVLNRENYVNIKALESSAESPLYSTELNDFADNVQIVEFDDFVHDQRLLAQKTLAKVPT